MYAAPSAPFHRIRENYLKAYQKLALDEPDSSAGQTLQEAFPGLCQTAKAVNEFSDSEICKAIKELRPTITQIPKHRFAKLSSPYLDVSVVRLLKLASETKARSVFPWFTPAPCAGPARRAGRRP